MLDRKQCYKQWRFVTQNVCFWGGHKVRHKMFWGSAIRIPLELLLFLAFPIENSKIFWVARAPPPCMDGPSMVTRR